MKFRSLSTILAASLVILMATVSCKKDDEDETYVYLSGSISLPYPTFVKVGFSKSFCIDTLTTLNRDGDSTGIGYYYTNYKSVKDTIMKEDGTIVLEEFTITAPDSLATLTESVSGFATGYYSSTAYAYYTVVSESESITGILHTAEQETFTDKRDGKTYYIARNAGLEWMEPNLAWAGAGKPYSCETAMENLFGQYYTWEEAQTACPDGWRLPTDDDWLSLVKAYGAPAETKTFEDAKGGAGDQMVDAYFNGNKMWEYWPQVSLSNKSLMAVMPTGYATIHDGSYKFTGVNSYAIFWTSSERLGKGAYRYFYVDQNILFSGMGNKSYLAASVRCVR